MKYNENKISRGRRIMSLLEYLNEHIGQEVTQKQIARGIYTLNSTTLLNASVRAITSRTVGYLLKRKGIVKVRKGVFKLGIEGRIVFMQGKKKNKKKYKLR